MQSVNRLLFGPTKEERVKQVQSQLRSEQRQLDREMRNIDASVIKAKAEVKRLAKKNDLKSAKILAREVVRSNAQRNRLATSKARLNSIGLQLNHQMAMYKVTGAMGKSAEIMKMSNQLVKLPEMSAAMRQMSAEMVKAGIMEEMMEDTLDSGVLGEDEEELEEEAQGQVDKILFELTDGKLGQASTDPLPELQAPEVAQEATPSRREEEADMERMQAALDGLLKG
ncbi:hypothetical protein BCV69DRAFT_257990 [Microstroma glucosiphilum]|uniref:Snf7-domain-containing protein n=1 Tax=Pseudomicrostroma glucosiphilum TaxID=1684307 RepID=A0A316U9I6_9BASI|nr:hypothetical protein BCV69DRAFT_257990 [Pseudomicrostroma glucosiphilum]PWN21927.1 hypothetical protein BCV69DRAFT_257990 [Pseudomicrostroma glucosiphilum]